MIKTTGQSEYLGNLRLINTNSCQWFITTNYFRADIISALIFASTDAAYTWNCCPVCFHRRQYAPNVLWL
jgi:hypothetical protein